MTIALGMMMMMSRATTGRREGGTRRLLFSLHPHDYNLARSLSSFLNVAVAPSGIHFTSPLSSRIFFRSPLFRFLHEIEVGHRHEQCGAPFRSDLLAVTAEQLHIQNLH